MSPVQIPAFRAGVPDAGGMSGRAHSFFTGKSYTTGSVFCAACQCTATLISTEVDGIIDPRRAVQNGSHGTNAGVNNSRLAELAEN